MMPKVLPFRPSICIDAVLGDHDCAAAIDTVAACGFDAFEFWGWWDKDLDAIENARDRHQMRIAACCTKFVSLVDSDLRDDYLDGLSASIAAAIRLRCPTLISQVGDFRPGVDRQSQHECLVDGLKAAASILDGTGVTLTIEPLNQRIDHPGYYLVRSERAFEIVDQVDVDQVDDDQVDVDQVDDDNVKVLFDIYHQRISEGNVIENLTNNIDKIGHFHVIHDTGYVGFVGLEYWPVDDTESGLREVAGWFRR